MLKRFNQFFTKAETLPENAKVIEGEMFVVPNPAHRLSSPNTVNPKIPDSDFSRSGYTEEELKFFDERIYHGDRILANELRKNFGDEYISAGNIFVEVWSTRRALERGVENEYLSWQNKGVDKDIVKENNLISTHIDFDRDTNEIKRERTLMPHYFPKEFLEGIKDGESLILKTLNKDREEIYYKLTANQKGGRYNNYNDFSEALKAVVDNATITAFADETV